MVQALQEAWNYLTETGQAHDEPLTKAALSRAILQAADQGARAQPVLVAYALAHLERIKVEVRKSMNPRGL